MLPDLPRIPEDSAYMRNAVPVCTGTPASDTVMPDGLFENTTRGVGTTLPPSGTMRTESEASAGFAPAVTSFCALRPETAYAKVFEVLPPIVTFVTPPLGSKNCKVPFRSFSVGFTRMICVAQPPPSVNCGTITGPLIGGVVVSMTGRDDIRKSPRWLTSVRRAITPTGTIEGKLNVP